MHLRWRSVQLQMYYVRTYVVICALWALEGRMGRVGGWAGSNGNAPKSATYVRTRLNVRYVAGSNACV